MPLHTAGPEEVVMPECPECQLIYLTWWTSNSGAQIYCCPNNHEWIAGYAGEDD